jgi:cytochrome c
MGLKRFAAISALLFVAGAAQAQAVDPAMGGPGDAARGQVQFKTRCSICHQPDKSGKNGVGPALWGAYGRTAAMSTNGFMYSDKLKASGIVWTPANLNQWIQKPTSLVPGVKMVLPPVTDPQDRADIIAFLKTESDVKESPARRPRGPARGHRDRDHDRDRH